MSPKDFYFNGLFHCFWRAIGNCWSHKTSIPSTARCTPQVWKRALHRFLRSDVSAHPLLRSGFALIPLHFCRCERAHTQRFSFTHTQVFGSRALVSSRSQTHSGRVPGGSILSHQHIAGLLAGWTSIAQVTRLRSPWSMRPHLYRDSCECVLTPTPSHVVSNRSSTRTACYQLVLAPCV